MVTKREMFSVTHESVTVPVGRDRKIQTALKTNQTARFITMPSEKKKQCVVLRLKFRHYFKSALNLQSNKTSKLNQVLKISFTSVKLTSVNNFYKSRKLKVNCRFAVHIFHLLAILKAH